MEFGWKIPFFGSIKSQLSHVRQILKKFLMAKKSQEYIHLHKVCRNQPN